MNQVLESYYRHLGRGQAKLLKLMGAPTEVSASGSCVIDDEGREYLALGGYGVFLLGHGHHRVVSAVADQLQRRPLATRLLPDPVLAEAASRLTSKAPPGLERVLFRTSGAEATEAALKLAWLNGRRRVISMVGGYHGKTLGALGVSGRQVYRAPFAGLVPDVEFVQFGDGSALANVLAQSDEPACVILEPIQGEAGVVVPPHGYLADVETSCRRHGALLVLDEIQTGLGRLGTWWGAGRDGIRPDVLLAGKVLGGGVVPVGALLATAEAFAPFDHDPFLHSSTFAGSPLAGAAVSATLRILEEEDVPSRAARLGQQLLSDLEDVAATAPELIRAVRGVGLLLAIEFHEPHLAADVTLELLQRQILVNHSLHAQNVLRLTPPVTLGDGERAWFRSALEDALAVVNGRQPVLV